tara:strand:- start:113 stop:268 length:156 start_codon:yes stop_codon:yes gene_type:complete
LAENPKSSSNGIMIKFKLPNWVSRTMVIALLAKALFVASLVVLIFAGIMTS